MTAKESLLPLTNEQRKLTKIRKDGITQTPLMKLGSWVYDHGGDVRGAPVILLDETAAHVASRISTLSTQKQSGRVHVQIKWLRRWQQIITQELNRK